MGYDGQDNIGHVGIYYFLNIYISSSCVILLTNILNFLAIYCICVYKYKYIINLFTYSFTHDKFRMFWLCGIKYLILLLVYFITLYICM